MFVARSRHKITRACQPIESLETRRLLSTLIYNADFEDGSGGASNDGYTLDASPSNLWHTSSVRYQSPTHAMYYGIDATRDYNTGATNSGAITSGAISLVGQTAATLSFRYLLGAEPLFPGETQPFEVIKLEVSTNGTTWTQLANSGNTITNDGLWHSWTGSLDAYLGQSSVQLRFTFDTVDNLGNGYEGWFLDDINVYGGADLPPTLVSMTPADDQSITTSSRTIQYVFNENVTGVDASDLVLSGSAAASASVSSVTGSGTTWSLQVTGLTNGLLNVTLAPDAGDIVDSASQSLSPVSARYGVELPDIYEANENFAGAVNLGVIGGIRDLNNLSIHNGTDLDFFKFVPDASGTVTLTANFRTNLPSAYSIEAYDGSQVAVTDTNAADEIVSFTATAGQTYYIKVYSELQDPLHSYDINIAAPTSIAPRVAQVYVRGSSWSTAFLDFIASQGLGDNTLGYAVPGGVNQLKSLPWTNLNTVSVKFSEAVNLDKQDMAMAGINVATYDVAGSTFSYNGTTFVGTWQFASALALDKVVLALNADGTSPITDLSGARLDGEFTTSTTVFPSGNGTAGGNFAFRFNVFPGDVNQSGSVTGTDFILVRNAQLNAPGTALYSVLKDVNGTASITGTDLILVRNRQLTFLPGGEPVVPVFA